MTKENDDLPRKQKKKDGDGDSKPVRKVAKTQIDASGSWQVKPAKGAKAVPSSEAAPPADQAVANAKAPDKVATSKPDNQVVDAVQVDGDLQKPASGSPVEPPQPKVQPMKRAARTVLENPAAPMQPVKKTMLENSMAAVEPDAMLAETPAPVPTPEPANAKSESPKPEGPKTVNPKPVQAVAKTKLENSATPEKPVARTMLENPIAGSREISRSMEMEILVYEEPLTAPQEGQPPLSFEPPRQYVAKTKLDHQVLMDMSERFAEKRDKELALIAKEKAKEPVAEVEQITEFKLAAACSWSWNDAKPNERFRSCEKCQMQIYNFDGVGRQEAEAIIFRRENRKSFTLYKRDDGKFMTGPCLMEVKRKNEFATLIVLCTLISVSFLVILLLMPRAPKPAATVAPPVVPQAATPTAPPRFSTSKRGSYHYENGKVTRIPPAAATTAPVTPPTPVPPSQDSNNQVWQYTNDADSQVPVNNSGAGR